MLPLDRQVEFGDEDVKKTNKYRQALQTCTRFVEEYNSALRKHTIANLSKTD